LWGFGKKPITRVPPENEITRIMSHIGFEYLEITDKSALIKHKEGLTLDLASIAKGYGVDQIAQILRENRLTDFLVEIGGEVVASGHRLDGDNWKVGINRPQPTAALNAVYKVLKLSNKALATSGDYRNFFELDGVRYSHVLDPRTGFPVSNGVVSVSIIAGNCTLADGLATAIMVMGPEKGLAVIDALKNVESLIIVHRSDGALLEYVSKGFEAYLLK
jgi:thiamine biosynthesis lipoprotein